MANNTTWMVRAGKRVYLAEEFLQKHMVSIGWQHIGHLSKVPT